MVHRYIRSCRGCSGNTLILRNQRKFIFTVEGHRAAPSLLSVICCLCFLWTLLRDWWVCIARTSLNRPASPTWSLLGLAFPPAFFSSALLQCGHSHTCDRSAAICPRKTGREKLLERVFVTLCLTDFRLESCPVKLLSRQLLRYCVFVPLAICLCVCYEALVFVPSVQGEVPAFCLV